MLAQQSMALCMYCMWAYPGGLVKSSAAVQPQPLLDVQQPICMHGVFQKVIRNGSTVDKGTDELCALVYISNLSC